MYFLRFKPESIKVKNQEEIKLNTETEIKLCLEIKFKNDIVEQYVSKIITGDNEDDFYYTYLLQNSLNNEDKNSLEIVKDLRENFFIDLDKIFIS